MTNSDSCTTLTTLCNAFTPDSLLWPHPDFHSAAAQHSAHWQDRCGELLSLRSSCAVSEDLY